jgi:dihydrofolate reductase
MARILGYIATSLDGFIADKDESLQWLFDTKVELGPYHYDLFIKRIRTVVMGRATYDWVVNAGSPNPYPSQRNIVVTSRPLDGAPDVIEPWNKSIDDLVAYLRGLDDGDVWMLGGGKLQMAFIERGALDEIEIYVMPRMIGGGYPLFPATGVSLSPRLISATELEGGGVRLHYAFT